MRTTRTSVLPHFAARVLLFSGAAALAASLAGCKSNSTPAPIITNNSAAANPSGSDPADANMAGYSRQTTQVMGQSQSYTQQQQGESYAPSQQAPAPIVQGYNNNSASNEAYSPRAEL